MDDVERASQPGSQMAQNKENLNSQKQTKNPQITKQMMSQALEEQAAKNKLDTIINLQTDNKNQEQNLNDAFKEVKSKKQRRYQHSLQIGTARDEEHDKTFQSTLEEKKIWLFIKRVKDTVDEDIIRNYIKSKTKCTDSEVEIKSLKEKTKNNSNCFLIGVNRS